MIKSQDLAADINALMLEIGAKLDASVAVVQENASKEEFARYRDAVGKIMGDILLDVMNPLYELHPEIRPKELS